MTRAALLALAAAAVGGCAAPPAPPESTANARAARDPSPSPSPATGAARIVVRIEFEPPLLAPGELDYACETGERGTVPTACTGVDLALPPGPVFFCLRAAGSRHELAVRTTPGMGPVVLTRR